MITKDTIYYGRSELSEAIKRRIKSKEESLGRTCRKIWEFTNVKGERYLFSSFTKKRGEVDKPPIIVTLAYFDFRICKFIPSN